MGAVFPNYQVVYPGTPAIIKCMGESRRVSWERDGVKIRSKKELLGKNKQMATVLFPSVLEENEGTYECIGSGRQSFRTESELYSAGNKR